MRRRTGAGEGEQDDEKENRSRRSRTGAEEGEQEEEK